MKKPITLSHEFLDEILTPQSILVDATMGKGNDTLYFAPKVKMLYAFDIQQAAIEATRAKLEAESMSNVQLILDGHEHVDDYVEKIDAAIFNLGYLPSADKSVITKAETTIEAVEKMMSALTVGGRISIMVYYGHEGGNLEKMALMQYLKNCDQKQFGIMQYKALNQVNQPPYLIMIEKLTK